MENELILHVSKAKTGNDCFPSVTQARKAFRKMEASLQPLRLIREFIMKKSR